MRYGSFDNLQLSYLKTETGRLKPLVNLSSFDNLIHVLGIHTSRRKAGRIKALDSLSNTGIHMFWTTYNSYLESW